MSGLISRICSMPKDFHSLGNKSMNELFIESGYSMAPSQVTKDALIAHLSANQELITEWENYSSDKRVSEGWYLLNDKPWWIVGYAGSSNKENRYSFESGIEACAEFILRELKQFTEHTTIE